MKISIAPKKFILFFRTIYFIVAVFLPIWRFAMPPESIDPMVLRLGISGILILQILSTFVWKFSIPQLKALFYVSVTTICLWFCYVVYLNDLSPEYTIAYFLTLFLAPNVNPDKKWILPFILINLAGSIAVIALVDDPRISKEYFIMVEVFFMVILYLTNTFQINISLGMEKQTRLSQEIARAAFETSKHGIIVVNKNRKVIGTNQQFHQIWQEEDHYLGLNGIDLGRAHAKSRVVDPESFLATEDYAHQNPEKTTQDTFQLKDGRSFERFSQPLITDNVISGRFWYITDITEQMTYQMELEQNLSLIKTIFDVSEMGIVVFDEEGEIKTYNDNFLRIWEVSKEELEQGPLQEVMYKCFQKTEDPEGELAYRMAMAKGEVKPPFRNLRFKGGKIVQRSSSKLENNGKDLGQVWFYRDVTEHESRHEALKKRNKELDNFIYRTSHDFKAPLNSIMGLATVASSESNLPDARKYIDLIYSSTIKLEGYVRNLADFSFIERESLKIDVVDLKQITQNAIEIHRYLYGDNNIEFEINITQETPFISDHARLLIILSNLISNGIKYHDPTKEKNIIKIEGKISEAVSEIRIFDNGLGIDKANLDQVWDMYFRASNRSFGSGMGLYIVKNAIDHLQGELDIKSSPKEWTEVLISIPNYLQKDKPEKQSLPSWESTST